MKKSLAVLFCVLLAGVSPVFADGPIFVDSSPNVMAHDIYAVDKNVIVAKLTNLVLKKPEKELAPENITVESKDDADFSAGVHPSQIGVWVKPVRFSLRKDLCVKSSSFYLFMEKSIKSGKTYTVKFSGLNFEALSFQTGKRDKKADATAPELVFKWEGDFSRSTAVHVNQAGYLPDGPKIAYLTQYAGWKNAQDNSPVEVDFSAYREYKIVDAETGKEAYKGQISLSPACKKDGAVIPDRLSETRVWEMNFTEFKVPGTYRIVVPGVGASFPFMIGKKTYNHVVGTLMRGFYHQRCGTELLPEFTRFPHPICHKDDARIPAVEEYKSDEADFYPQQAGKYHPCAKGHHDAGDFGKYVSNGSLVVFNLLFPFEVFPEKLQFDNSPLPNAGNGIPDLIDEAKWELDWLSDMQDDDGLVFLLVKPDPTMSYEDSVAGRPSKQYDKQRCLWWKDLHVTASFAAALARAARTPDFVKYYPQDSKTYIEKAEKAWDACMKHTDKDGEPDDLVKGPAHSGSYLNAKDEYCWMAVELWLATGKQKYHDYFLKHFNPKDSVQWGWWPLFVHAGAATRAYVFGKRDGKDPEKLKECKEYVLGAADSAMKWQDGWATRCSFAEDPYRFGKWGWYYLSEIASYNLLTASAIADPEKAKKYRDAAIYNADQELGNSADDIVSITGIGFKRPVDIVHQNSRFDGINEPIPGIPMGFHPTTYNMGSSARELMSSYTKGGLPIAYRYVDCWWVSQEFMCPQLADTAIVYALLSDMKEQKAGKPSLKASANTKEKSVSGMSPFKVTFKADAQGANGKKIVNYFWDLDNEEFGCDKIFDYTFKVPGIYNVCCTVTDEDGWISYENIQVKVAQEAAMLPNKGEAFNKKEDTLALWHFDGTNKDLVSGKEAVFTGTAQISDKNLMWMKNMSGKAVECAKQGDGILLEFEGNYFTDPNLQAFKAEALINYEGDFARGSGHSQIFYLTTDGWDCGLGIVRDTWIGRGFKGSNDEVIKSKVMEIFYPQPGWHYVSLGFDKASGKALIQFDDKKVELPFTPGTSGGKTKFMIGGFNGFIDELRISQTGRTGKN